MYDVYIVNRNNRLSACHVSSEYAGIHSGRRAIYERRVLQYTYVRYYYNSYLRWKKKKVNK